MQNPGQYTITSYQEVAPSARRVRYLKAMTSWNISRHPEWDQLLLAGITAREIAELCHRGPATIHYHLRRREHYEPGFRAKHEAAVATRNNNRPSSTWRRQATELATFHAEHKRLPRSTGDRAERSLHHWLTIQRKELQSGQLPAAKILLLQDVPDWHIDPRQRELDERWSERFEALRQFVAESGHFPRYRTYTSEKERSLGVWLHNQHQRRAEGKLAAWRHDALDHEFAGWRSYA